VTDPVAGGPPPRPYFNTPNAEKYVLEADAMRRRQLRSALLHGSARTWREHRRVWPAVVVGVVVVAVMIAAMAVVEAYNRYQEQQETTTGARSHAPAQASSLPNPLNRSGGAV